MRPLPNTVEAHKKPEGLCPEGEKAYAIIDRVLREAFKDEDEGLPYTGGCRTFYSPAEWKARGEKYGTDGVLIVVYDGGDVAPYFNLEEDGYGKNAYKRTGRMDKALRAEGLYAEECTGWFSAVYPV